MAYVYKTIKVNGKTKLLHRHVAEQRLGRPLRFEEQVHHINGDRWDNRPENLEVLTPKEHQGHHKQKHAKVKVCWMCGVEFEPHPTKRARVKTCGWPCGYELSLRTRLGEEPPFCPPMAEAIVAANARAA